MADDSISKETNAARSSFQSDSVVARRLLTKEKLEETFSVIPK